MIFSHRTYQILTIIALVIVVSAWVPWLQTVAYLCDLFWLLVWLTDYWLTPPAKLITATRQVTDRLSVGRENAVTILVSNLGLVAAHCRVRDDYPGESEVTETEFSFDLPAQGISQLNYSLTPRRRGTYQFGDITIRYLSFLGLFWRQKRIHCSKDVKVYCDLRALHDLTIKLSRSLELGELRKRKRGQGTEFSSLREYTVGDDAKSIDWKATARRDRPIVRNYEAQQEQRVLILIDAGRMMVSDLEGLSRFDHALNAGLCLALTGLMYNDQVGFGIFADRPIAYLPPKRGRTYLKKILELSFDIEPRMVEPDYSGVLSYFASTQKGRCLMVILTDLTDATGSQTLLSGLACLAPRHLPFCVTLCDRQLVSIAELNSVNDIVGGAKLPLSERLDHIYQRAIATDLLAGRELALSQLQRRGCLVLDCPPQELSSKLVDSYLAIKTRERL